MAATGAQPAIPRPPTAPTTTATASAQPTPANLAPTAAGGGWSLSTMRRRPDVPNGLTEFLIVETLAWAKAEDVAEVSLNFCAFTEFISPERAVTLRRRFLRRALLAADGVFQLERLYVFNRKFFPEWRPRYLCVERLSDLPLVGLAYLHVEQLLVPPAPWRRSPPEVLRTSGGV